MTRGGLQVGEFQCYDRRALASLAQAAQEAGHPEWGRGGPHDTGTYVSHPEVRWPVGGQLTHSARALAWLAACNAGRAAPTL